MVQDKKLPFAAMTKKAEAFGLFAQGMKPSSPEVKALGLSPKTRYNYYQLWKKSADAGQPIAMPKGQTLAVPAGETIEATSIKLVPRVQTISLTPDIFISYMCAVSRGFPGGLDRFLSIVALDFWEGRGVDAYKEVKGGNTSDLAVKGLPQYFDKGGV